MSSALTPVAAGFQINDLSDVLLPTTVYVTAKDTPLEICYKNINPASWSDSQNGCSNTMFASMAKGDWGLTYNTNTGISYPGNTCSGTKCYKEVHGISACSNKSGTYAVMDPESIYTDLQNAYETGLDGSTPPGRYCHCRLIEPHIGVSTSVSPWVYVTSYGTKDACSRDCAGNCANYTRLRAVIRGEMFSAINPN